MKMPSLYLVMLVFLIFGVPALQAQEEQDKGPESGEVPEEPSAAKEKEAVKTIEELIEDSDRIDGLLTFYQDRKTGELRLLLSQDQLDREYLYFSYTENGVAGTGWLIRGSFQMSTAKVFEIRRFFNRIEFVQKNTSYYFDPDKAISRAANANISHSVFFEEKIESEDEEDNRLLIKVDKLFLSESFQKITPMPVFS